MPAYNYTIDDSQWSTPPLSLSGGWNMLREGGSNEYIDPDQVAVMTPLLGEFWNNSVSWTKYAGSWTTLRFIGTDIWAYGMKGSAQGEFIASVDDREIGRMSAKGGETPDYHHLLFSAHDLEEGVVHTLRLENGEEDKLLVFDYAMVQTSSKDPSVPWTCVSSTQVTSVITPAATSSVIPSTTAPLGLIVPNLTGAEDLSPAAVAQHQYSPSQLALLATKYHFEWNASAYFVVVFAGILLFTILGLMALYVFPARLGQRNSRSKVSRMEKGLNGSARSGESFLVASKERRRDTKLLDALRKGKISHPIPSEDGHSTVGSERGGEGWKGRQDYE